METRIKITELPYLTHVPTDGRYTPLLSYYDVDKIAFFTLEKIPENIDDILVYRVDNFTETLYLAKEPVIEVDCHLPLFEIILQHFWFPGVSGRLEPVYQDIINMLVSIHKYFVFLNYHQRSKESMIASLMMQTELEYVFTNWRSFYDLLHKIILTLSESDKYWPKVSLPDSFRDVVKKEDFAARYKLPKPLLKFYEQRKSVFEAIRNIRDAINHHGKKSEWLYCFDNGFAIPVRDPLIQKMNVRQLWPDHLLRRSVFGLGSVLAIFVFLLQDMLGAMQDIGESLLRSCETLPQSVIAPDYKLFFRSPLVKHLAMLDTYRDKHWFDPKEILGIKANED